MAHAIFNLDAIGELPLWGQVLLASRMARRAAYALGGESMARMRRVLTAGCDAVDRCAQAGAWLDEERAAIGAAREIAASGDDLAAAEAFACVADATHAAHESLDFSAAETACVHSAAKALACAAEAPGLSPLQVRIYAAADLDQLRFACSEAGVGRYDALGLHVMGRLAPVHRPDARA